MLLVDAGSLYAAAAARDNDHIACEQLLAEANGPLLVGELVVTEVSYLLAHGALVVRIVRAGPGRTRARAPGPRPCAFVSGN